MNPDKCHRKDLLLSFLIDILSNNISPHHLLENLFDEDLCFVPHIYSIVKSCHHHMRELRQIRQHLDRDTTISVAHGLAQKYILKLQQVQNTLV